MSESADPQPATPPKRPRSARGQSVGDMKKRGETATTAQLAAEDQAASTQIEPATSPLPPNPPRSRSASGKKKESQQMMTTTHPAPDDREGWKIYWAAQGQSWRTEPAVGEERQKYLAERQVIHPDFKKDIYPFKDIKLSRADVEWLLATHENGRGPVDWSDESQRQRDGLYLSHSDLRATNLAGLPLARTRFGLAQLQGASLLSLPFNQQQGVGEEG